MPQHWPRASVRLAFGTRPPPCAGVVSNRPNISQADPPSFLTWDFLMCGLRTIAVLPGGMPTQNRHPGNLIGGSWGAPFGGLNITSGQATVVLVMSPKGACRPLQFPPFWGWHACGSWTTYCVYVYMHTYTQIVGWMEGEEV